MCGRHIPSLAASAPNDGSASPQLITLAPSGLPPPSTETPNHTLHQHRAPPAPTRLAAATHQCTLALMKWTEQKSERFQVLRHAEAHHTLSTADKAELEALLAQLDANESEALQPALRRMDAECAAMSTEKSNLDAQATELARIAIEEERLSTEARAYLEQLRQRSAVLAEDYRRATGRDPAPDRDLTPSR